MCVCVRECGWKHFINFMEMWLTDNIYDQRRLVCKYEWYGLCMCAFIPPALTKAFIKSIYDIITPIPIYMFHDV